MLWSESASRVAAYAGLEPNAHAAFSASVDSERSTPVTPSATCVLEQAAGLLRSIGERSLVRARAPMPNRYAPKALDCASGVPTRTIHEWIRRKLLAPPIGSGRGAHYNEAHALARAGDPALAVGGVVDRRDSGARAGAVGRGARGVVARRGSGSRGPTEVRGELVGAHCGAERAAGRERDLSAARGLAEA